MSININVCLVYKTKWVNSLRVKIKKIKTFEKFMKISEREMHQVHSMRTAGYTRWEHKKNKDILKQFKIESILSYNQLQRPNQLKSYQ